jgi:HD-GYP domain-containing protein (c-di-GMP phosphodiesterase class II)
MIQLSIDELQPGMVVARSILGSGIGMALAAGYVLDEPVILRLKRTGIRSLWVSMGEDDVLPSGNVNDQLALQAQNAWKDNMDILQKVGETQDSTLENLSKFTADPGRFKDMIASEKVKSVVDQIIRSILGQEPLVVNLASIRTKDGFLYQHALDVAITCTMIGSRLKFPLQDIQELALGAFLMDLGMIIVPPALLEKKEPLTASEQNLFREHPSVGFAILRANEGIPINAAHVAFQHHERLDGTGFPRGLKAADQFPHKVLHNVGGNIHRYAQIAAVADAYLEAISPRPGTREPSTPMDAMRMLIGEAGKRLNSHVVNALITLVPAFPQGTRIVVVKAPASILVGHTGVVSQANPLNQDKPQVVLLFDKFKRKIKPLLLDLTEEKDVEIQFAPV